ncbi:MAG TPA: class I SAM-dependent methyltransferase [Alphaproteobacteria bacterium]|nr:class I SAM-dependent methyltransferase [Alphaproteobacteria bacterium]
MPPEKLTGLIARLPVIGSVQRKIYQKLLPFPGSRRYWQRRYLLGGHSGVGSSGKFAAYKAEILNRFVDEHGINSVIEWGCGDGSQLRLAAYPRYLGLDVSKAAIEKCRRLFSDDRSKRFLLTDAYDGETAELALSLDVLYHLVEEDTFTAYMQRLFASASRFVIIYSSDQDSPRNPKAEHVRHRHFTPWIEANMADWTLMRHIPNRFPYHGDHREGSVADFFIYERSQPAAQ